MLNLTNTSDYQKTVLAVFDVISTDALAILNKPLLPVLPLSIKVYFDNISDTDALLPDRTTRSTLTYANGTWINRYPAEAFIYTNTVYNLIFVAIDAVNLDLGNIRAPNMFRNASRLPKVVYNNKVPPGIDASNWVGGVESWYYGRITPPYETWAKMLCNNQPANILLGHPTGLPKESVMVTSYLCQAYQIKLLKSLLSSVFIGSAAMASTVWSRWFLIVALLANGQTEPCAKCQCEDCLKREQEKEEMRKAASTRLFGKLCTMLSRAKHTINSRDSQQSQLPFLTHRPTSDSGSLAKGE
ncbi:hypothetical protein RSOLAG22IIIB_10293 [Rhizoctonia solani]|uniref:Uncharacterized protein n=1 Tax=Rhizoctonia solani TaxID=456999 RepID=A0A0K6G328_9AGAM|nr:hypothetical protein RSOLAG22IIIB_10293 [Rhizoctonia solani]